MEFRRNRTPPQLLFSYATGTLKPLSGVELVEMLTQSPATRSSRPPASVALLAVISSLSASTHESFRGREGCLELVHRPLRPVGSPTLGGAGHPAPGRSRPSDSPWAGPARLDHSESGLGFRIAASPALSL